MIQASNLTKRFGKLTAVDDLSFTVSPGVVTGFLGPNGAGKSTTMRMVLGLDNPTSGTVTIGGRQYAHLDNPLRTVGALLDAKWVHTNRSARDHLRWMAAAADLPAKRVDEVLELVGLTSVAKKRAGQFSLGMSQRLGIAGALLGDPQVLMFDEPVNGLDPEGIVWIRNFMKRLAADGRTVFVSSHLLSEMALTADELVVIGRGRLIAECSTQEFVARSAGSGVLLRTPDAGVVRPALEAAGLQVDEEVAGSLLVTTATADPLAVADGATEPAAAADELTTDTVGRLAASVGATVLELSVRRASLEEAFMAMTGESVEFGGSDADAHAGQLDDVYESTAAASQPGGAA
jgi:ABC-2 type transport system ATP-binding protein